MKRVLVANDLSCVGKVALTNALPVLNSCHIETTPLPTVLLSTHTAFNQPFKQVLTTQMVSILNHFNQLSLSFDAVLTGYFGHAKQLNLFLKYMPKYDKLIVDPVMADNGRLYKGFSKSYPKTMLKLCQKADVILPNLTEASLLTQSPYPKSCDKETIEYMLKKLYQLTHCQHIILTGLQFEDTHLSIAYYHNNHIQYFKTRYIPQHFFGTGDLFSALITSFILSDKKIDVAIRKSLDILFNCLDYTITHQKDLTLGVLFEPFLDTIAQTVVH